MASDLLTETIQLRYPRLLASGVDYNDAQMVLRRITRIAPHDTCSGTEVVGGDSMYGQSKAILTKSKHLMEAAGGRMDDIVKVVVFVTDIKRREEFWKARREVFSGDFPVSTLVEVRALAAPELLVEVEAVAVLGAGG